jgi:hypothetical protein
MRHRTRVPRRPRPRHRRLNAAAAAVAALVLFGLLLSPAAADDRHLLRFDSAKPYLFIVLDTSASMAMRMGRDEWAPGGADGPDSRLYQAKQALFNVLKDVNDVHLGFAGFNQDRVRAVGKHWLYFSDNDLPSATEWPIQFPRPDKWDVDGDTSFLTGMKVIPPVDAEGDPIPNPPEQTADTRVTEIGLVDLATGRVDVPADVMTFGPALATPQPQSFTDSEGRTATRVVAATCASPLDLADPLERDQLESLSIVPSTENPTYAWVEAGNATYLLAVRRPGSRPDDTANAFVGELGKKLHVLFELRKVASGKSSCGSIETTSYDSTFGTKTLRLDMRLDTHLNQFFHVNQAEWDPEQPDESTMPVWLGSDVQSATEFADKPHSGFGWEGNYDSGTFTSDDAFDDRLAANADAHVADFCIEADDCFPSGSRVKPVSPTTVNTLGRALDSGDMIPFDWNFTRRLEFLRRLDPSYDGTVGALGDFRVARYFDSSPAGGVLPLAGSAVPLLAADVSPLARALTDVRCWYLGSDDNKCKEGQGVPVAERRYPEGWSTIACNHDSSYGCRRSFLIVIGDGEDNVAGQDANGSIGNLRTQANMQTWALNVGNPRGCNSGGGLHSIVRAGGGECVNVETQEQLRQVLQALIGQIRTTARSFASAAVPSVQATVDQKIFLTSFLPFNDSSVWRGSVHSFVKPLPVGPSGVPLTEARCDGEGDITVDDRTQGCHLWDAGRILFDKQYPASGTDFLDFAAIDKRRVFYSLQSAPGGWATQMRLLDPAPIAEGESDEEREMRHDLWRGIGLTFTGDDTSPVDLEAQTAANGVVQFTLSKKTGTERNTDFNPPLLTPHTFLLGDIFHSTPVVVGTPSNTTYFAGDLYGNGRECSPNVGTIAANPGYRCFFEKQRFRRKMLLVGSNDGMLHAFDAGMFRRDGNDHWTDADLQDDELDPFGSFDNGTGKELFGYVPRMVLPTLNSMRQDDGHFYTVDGTVTVADVFIDPVGQAGSSTFPEADDREWRTVVVGGLREGGSGYYGLDVTQPDPVTRNEDLHLFFPVTAAGGDNDPDSGQFVPVCTASLSAGDAGIVAPQSATGCGRVPFPAILWEFTDSHYDAASDRLFYADEELPPGLDDIDGDVVVVDLDLLGNGRRDLAATWSTPNIGRIRLCETGGTACDPTPDDAPDENGERHEDDDLRDVFVAVVGGGFDTLTKLHDWRPSARGGDGVPLERAGNWLYIIDIETGEAIYKRELQGAVPSEPAAVDTDGDGYLDRIYVGTLAGLLYRVDLDPVIGGSGDDSLPATEDLPVAHFHPQSGEERVFDKRRVPEGVWDPVPLFDTNFDGATDAARQRQIYQRPSVIFQAGSGEYVIAFGTGDRDDLWNVPLIDSQERFYVFVDPFVSSAHATTPMTEATLAPIDPGSADSSGNLLESNGGWVMRLAAKERVITDAFALSGVMVFSTFVPRIEDGAGNEQVIVGCSANSGGNQGGGGNNNNTQAKTCAKQGLSNVFVVNTTNANGLLFEGSSSTRFKTAPTFVTNPFAEPGQTMRTSGENEEGEHTADDLSANMIRVMESLKELFPPQCKFANYRIDIKTVAADTSLQFIAAVPVCLIESNWKEF